MLNVVASINFGLINGLLKMPCAFIQSGAKITHGFSNTTTHLKNMHSFYYPFKNMHSFYYPFKKHVFLLPISKTCVLFNTHFKNMRSFLCHPVFYNFVLGCLWLLHCMEKSAIVLIMKDSSDGS
jgi:hypothetical protein